MDTPGSAPDALGGAVGRGSELDVAHISPGAPDWADPWQVARWFDDAVDIELPAADGSLAAARDAADAYARMSKADNTRRAYRAAVRVWCAWCVRHALPALPAAGRDVAAFLADGRRQGLVPATLTLRRAAIRHLHRLAECAVPTGDACVAETMAGIQRDAAARGEAPRQKVAATAAVLRRLLAPIADDPTGLRDRAILLVGYAGALRRGELAAITVEQLEATDGGIRLTLGQTKGSQARAVTVALPHGETELCPVRALERWRRAAGITEGPVFRRIWPPKRRGPAADRDIGQAEVRDAAATRSAEATSPIRPHIGPLAITPQTVSLVVQARARAAGFRLGDLGGHSLKRGALTTGMDRGVHPAALKRLGRHKTFEVLGEYLEFGDLFENHPLAGVL